jgi:metallo-beta-lactamase family protein
MKITFHGAAGTTTGSKHLIEVNGAKILLDCGLFQGRRSETIERNSKFHFDVTSIDCVVLSHAHIDHTGALPLLCKSGFKGNIYSTPATRDLSSIMLPDAGHIHEQDIIWLNKQRAKESMAPLEPYYTRRDAELTLRQFVSVGYQRPMYIADGVKMTFVEAGHILGSAQVLLDIDDRETGKKSRLLFSGDIGRPENDLLNPAEPTQDVDYIIMESTYGGRRHELPAESSDRICEIIKRAQEQRGKLIIPAFAVERTQQLLYTFDKLTAQGCFKPLPVYVDSPLAVKATEIFRLHVNELKEEVHQASYTKEDPFGFEGLQLVRNINESKAINYIKGPAIIISASGMAETGRILHHLRNHIENKNTILLFVGYCAKNTLGARLREGAKKVNILGNEFRVKAQIEILDSFSGHADEQELLEYYERIQGKKEKVFLVHGDPERTQAMRKALLQGHPNLNITIPNEDESFSL